MGFVVNALEKVKGTGYVNLLEERVSQIADQVSIFASKAADNAMEQTAIQSAHSDAIAKAHQAMADDPDNKEQYKADIEREKAEQDAELSPLKLVEQYLKKMSGLFEQLQKKFETMLERERQMRDAHAQAEGKNMEFSMPKLSGLNG